MSCLLLLQVLNVPAAAQIDTIFLKCQQQILCRHIQDVNGQYRFLYRNDHQIWMHSRLLKCLVDSIKYEAGHSGNISKVIPQKGKNELTGAQTSASIPHEKYWTKTMSLGMNLSNVLEFNTPIGIDKKSLELNTSLDLGLNYQRTGNRFQMTNELHYVFGIQKDGLDSSAHYQRNSDELNTLHDLSLGIGKKRKWNFNLIAKFTTSFFTIYGGNYFGDIAATGPVQGFLSPYVLSLAPGIKFQPDAYLRISLSPYSVELTGIKSRQIANTGAFIKDTDASGSFKQFVNKRLGASVNIWYDRQIKDWLTLQYRLTVSSDYFEKIAENGQLDGLFITKIKLVKDLYLTHRAGIKLNLAASLIKPYYNQSLLLSYTKNF